MSMRMPLTLGLMLAAIGVGVAADKTDKKAGTQTVSLAGKSWSLLVDLPGFKREEEKTAPDGSVSMFQASNKKTGLIASVWLESDPDLTSTEACKTEYWGKASQSPFPKTDIKQVTVGSMAAVHWTVKEYQGMPLMQKNINAYLYRDGVCIDLHLSKMQYAPKDEPLFDAVLGTVRFSDQ